MNVGEIFYAPCKSVLQMIQMLKNACEYRCESYECVANETRTRRMGYKFAYYTMRMFFFVLYLPASVQFKFVLSVHIYPAFYGNVNMNASESFIPTSGFRPL